MKKRERDCVVELLRCAADRLLIGASMMAPFTDACEAIYGDRYSQPRVLATCRGLIYQIAPQWWSDFDNVQTAHAALEAAARVEEGTWP